MLIDEKRGDMPSSVIIESRKRATFSGVLDVISFDEQSVVLNTNSGTLTINGNEIHIERLSLDSGELALEGSIDGLQYSEISPSGGFFSRLFK